jgi:hypothetical protein
MTRQGLRDRSNQRQKGGHDRVEPALQPSGCADADQLPHQQSEIEAADVWISSRFRMFVCPRRCTRRILPVS